ncbi:MAG: TonB-dependent receptor [Bacteroidales bacterium]|nr:TonB-dependent receptor [Bacteroidales bacterium]MCF8333963.1 TonB-dependent receptor [Bacteroidales bacterium]
MQKLFFILIGVVLLPAITLAQHTLSGKVTNKKTGEPLPGAHVRLDKGYKTAVTDKNGEYELRGLSKGDYTLSISYLGFQTQTKRITLRENRTLDFALKNKAIMEEEVIINATRAGENVPTTFENIEKEDIEEINLGQDLPYMMSMTPSAVASSDAGTGIGYTGMRIRGTSLSRINVTINGIPYNDPESQGVFFVNLPDFASSVDNIQIQRGVGTSTNGAAAFGASVNIQTQTSSGEPYAEINSSAGSFNTLKNNVRAGTGLIDGKWAFDARLSKITSDGYIDRAESDLKSFFVSGAYFGESSILKINVFSGKERTYQSWYGVPKVRLENDVEGMQRYADHFLFSQEKVDHMMQSDSRTFNYYTYDNEIDNYQQDHYQMVYSNEINEYLNLNAALHYTHGEGYFEQMQRDESFSDYGLDPAVVSSDTINTTDLVRRKWLNNDFYGVTWSMMYDKKPVQLTVGGAYNEYDGDHYGNIIWSEFNSHFEKDYQWYFNNGFKRDFNIYGKLNYQINSVYNIYGDMQYRFIDYDIDGIHDDLRDISQQHTFNFLNPKFGIHADFSENHEAYASFAVANREPSRRNYRDAEAGEVPKKEVLYDYEMGYTYKTHAGKLAANVYYMDYQDQLIITGEINNVGEEIMTNVEDSYRAGIELMAGARILPELTWDVNMTFSRNKIKDFTTYVDNWDEGGQIKKELGTTDISFSPEIIGGSQISYEPLRNFKISLMSKYVGKQYIDNTSSEKRKLDPYFINHLLIDYSFSIGWFEEANISLKANNLFDEKYETNAWVYRYYYQEEYYKMTGYFPQAGRNYLLGLTLKF